MESGGCSETQECLIYGCDLSQKMSAGWTQEEVNGWWFLEYPGKGSMFVMEAWETKEGLL